MRNTYVKQAEKLGELVGWAENLIKVKGMELRVVWMDGFWNLFIEHPLLEGELFPTEQGVRMHSPSIHLVMTPTGKKPAFKWEKLLTHSGEVIDVTERSEK